MLASGWSVMQEQTAKRQGHKILRAFQSNLER